MSIIRAPYSSRRYKGALDSLVVSHILDKYFFDGAVLLDPMAGSKTIEKEARKLGMICESNDLYFPHGWDVLGKWPYDGPQFHGILLHPPYFGAKKYGDDPRDIGNIVDYATYIDKMAYILEQALEILITQGYVVVFMGDHRRGGIMTMVHADIYQRAVSLGLTLENYDLWEISATGTPFKSTKHMMMINWVMAFRLDEDEE